MFLEHPLQPLPLYHFQLLGGCSSWGDSSPCAHLALPRLGTAGLPGMLLRAELAPVLLLDHEAVLQTADVRAIEASIWARVVQLLTNSPRHAVLGGSRRIKTLSLVG